MAKNPNFNVIVKNDWIVISLILIKSIPQKKASTSNLILPDGARDPKNILEVEKQRQQGALTYADMPEQFKAEWDEHPMQGVISGLGPGVDPDDGYRVGQRVYFRGSTGEPMIIKKEFYLAIKPHDIYCTVPK